MSVGINLTIAGRNRYRNESKAICRRSTRSCDVLPLAREREAAMQLCLASDYARRSACGFELGSP
jgi:hypothetical protein